MKILQVHNFYYRGLGGGEDTVYNEEATLLRQHGNEVDQLTINTSAADVSSSLRSAYLGMSGIWSLSGYRLVLRRIAESQPDVIHVHNTFPKLSPSVYWAAHATNVPVVQTLHNYRLVCSNALLMRNGRPCEECLVASHRRAMRYRCYRNNLPATASIVAMLSVNRLLGTYHRKVDTYIALSAFAKDIMLRGGLPEDRVKIKANSVNDPCNGGTPVADRKKQVLFVGRVDELKGIDILLAAWSRQRRSAYELSILGDGPMREELQQRYSDRHDVSWLGHVTHDEVLRTVASSHLVVLPSRCYEGLSMVIVEALALGTPVLVPNHGAFPELASNGASGWLFTPGDENSLALTLKEALECAPYEWQAKSESARSLYLERYSPEPNYRQLIGIYEEAIASHRKRSR